MSASMQDDHPTVENEELRANAIRFINRVCSSHPLAYTDRDAIDDLMTLIASECRATRIDENDMWVERYSEALDLLKKHHLEGSATQRALAQVIADHKGRAASLKDTHKGTE